MDYRGFTDHGRGDWDALEGLLGRAQQRGLVRLEFEELERLNALHRRVMSDFSYARSHFPGTEAERRLRRLAFTGHRLLAARRQPLGPRVWQFFWQGFPRIFREAAPRLGTAVGLFVLATLLGFVATTLDERVAFMFLGPGHVEGLREGRVWTDSITSVTPSSVLASGIATNNISVALMAWAGGVLLGLGSVWILTMNGMMFGSVISVTWQYGLAGRLGQFIAAHGPLELFLITVAAAAGFGLARGQLTGDRLRSRTSMRDHARRSVRLMLGTLPWFVVLGVIEGYVSPAPEITLATKVVVGVAVLALFLVYACGVLRFAGRGDER